jgi:hypothetical protein
MLLSNVSPLYSQAAYDHRFISGGSSTGVDVNECSTMGGDYMPQFATLTNTTQPVIRQMLVQIQ